MFLILGLICLLIFGLFAYFIILEWLLIFLIPELIIIFLFENIMLNWIFTLIWLPLSIYLDIKLYKKYLTK